MKFKKGQKRASQGAGQAIYYESATYHVGHTLALSWVGRRGLEVK